MEWVCKLDGGPKRVNHAAVAIGDIIYSFGGFCNGTDFKQLEGIDVHAFNTLSWRWEQVETTPQWSPEDVKPGVEPRIPFKRYGHSVVAYKGKVYLWGGRNDHSVCNTLFCFDPRTRSWSVPEVKCKVAVPPACDGHSACVIGPKMYIFGGFEDATQQFSQELYAFDFEESSWRYIRPSTQTVPPQRDFHSAVAIGEEMYVFGGRSDEAAPHYTGRDTYPWRMYKFNTRTKAWSQLGRNIFPPSPKGRRSSSAFEYGGNVYVTCGYNGNEKTHYNDFYKFDVQSNQWVDIKPRGLGPNPRRRMSCCVLKDRVFFFGGTSPRTRVGDTGSDTTEDEDGGEGELRMLENHGDIFILDMNPSLRTACMLSVLRHKLDYSVLPWDIKLELERMNSGKAPQEPKSRDFKRCMMA